MVLYIFIFTLLLFKFIQYNWKRRHLYKLSWSLNGSYSFPIIGDGLIVNCKDEDILEVALEKITNRFPSPIKFWFGPLLTVFFTDVNHIQKIMSSTNFSQKGDIYRFIKEFTGDGLINNSGPKWKSDRRTLAPLFINKQVEKYFPCMLENSEILAKILEKQLNQPKFDVKKYIMRCTADIVNESILGVKSHAQRGNFDKILEAIQYLYVHVHSRISKVWLHPEIIYQLSGQKERGLKAYRSVLAFFEKSVNNMKQKHKEELKFGNSEDVDHCILNNLLYINDHMSNITTHKELLDHTVTFYTASEDTITIITTFSLTVFGMHPDIQDKIYEELRQVFGPTPRSVEPQDLFKLNYLNMCVKDILRLFPIAPFIIRKAVQDFEIDKWVIPKNCTVCVSIFNIHRDPTLWEKPNEFYPEHFLPEVAAKRNPYAYLPFSGGPRGCIGKPFANMAILTILATLLQRYEFITEGSLQNKKLKADITTRYKDNDYTTKIVSRLLKD